jgi:recombinational DNA repair protein RecR
MTADAELTAQVVGEALTSTLPPSIRVTTLARGLSTGTEIEYADPYTLSYALRFRFPFHSLSETEGYAAQNDEKKTGGKE